MILLPVIERELRATARQPFTYHVRLVAVLSLVAVLVYFAWQADIGPDSGGELFAALHLTLFVAIWVLVPLLTADCISRERREGTLPLLFLTPLKARDLVWAKGVAHALRALTLWAAAVPVLAICLVAGGVSWQEVVLSALVNFSALCLAAAAGLTASAATKVWTRALALGMTLAFVLLIASLHLLAFFIVSFVNFGRTPFSSVAQEAPTAIGWVMSTNWERAWQHVFGSMRLGAGTILATYVAFAGCALLVLLLLIRAAGWMVKHNWRQRPLSARALRLQEVLFKPTFFQKPLRRWLRWELQRNPIGWLERRSWSGRLVVWSWLAVVVCLYSSLFANQGLYQHGFHEMQVLLKWMLAGSIALSAAGSFRRERESGVLELLLVAPLREGQVILGRVRGLWGQFLPSVVLLCGVWLYWAGFLKSDEEWPSVLSALVTFATVPVVGLYFSLTCSNIIASLLFTFGLQLVLPAVLTQLVEALVPQPTVFSSSLPTSVAGLRILAYLWVIGPALQLMLAAGLGHRLWVKLRQRDFALPSGRS